MQIIDAKFKVKHDSTMCHLSEDHPDALMMLWCNGTTDVLQIASTGQDDLDNVLTSLKEVATVQELMKERESALTMVRGCACDGVHLPGVAEKSGCLCMGPCSYSGGWEILRVFAPNKSSLRECVSKLKLLGQVEIVSMKTRDQSDALMDLGIAPIPFFGGLTEKQIEVLVSAHESGLLSVPAKTKMDAVAKKVGLSRSTYGEHLRKAMQTLIENSYPVLKLYSQPYSHPGRERIDDGDQ